MLFRSGVGVNVLIAGYLGERKQDEANITVTHGLLLAFGIVLCFVGSDLVCSLGIFLYFGITFSIFHPVHVTSLVKRIVDSAGGTIKAENREYGGCRFVIEMCIRDSLFTIVAQVAESLEAF